MQMGNMSLANQIQVFIYRMCPSRKWETDLIAFDKSKRDKGKIFIHT